MPTASVQAVGTLSTGAGTCTPGVPTGTAAGSLLLAAISCLPDGTITTPTGYTNELLDDDQAPGIAVHFKKLSATESTPTVMSCGGGINNGAGIVLRVEDEDTAADPTHSAVSSASNGAGSTTSPAVSLTGTPAGLLVWVMAASAARDLTTLPSGFTRHTPTGTQRIHVCTKAHAGGDTGSITGIISSGSGMTAGLVLIKNATEITPSGISATAALGSPTIAAAAVSIAPTGIGSSSSVGIPTVTAGSVDVAPSEIGSTTSIGTATLVPAGVQVAPPAIADTATLGSPEVGSTSYIQPGAIGPGTTLGTATVTPGVMLLAPSGIGGTVLVGDLVITSVVDVAPDTIAPAASVGAPLVAAGVVLIAPAGLGPDATIGAILVRIEVEIPPERTVVIPGEDRTIVIPPEDRTVVVPAEDRTVTS